MTVSSCSPTPSSLPSFHPKASASDRKTSTFSWWKVPRWYGTCHRLDSSSMMSDGTPSDSDRFDAFPSLPPAEWRTTGTAVVSPTYWPHTSCAASDSITTMSSRYFAHSASINWTC